MSLRTYISTLFVASAMATATCGLAAQVRPETRISPSANLQARTVLADSVSARLQGAADEGTVHVALTDMILLLRRTEPQSDALAKLLDDQQNPRSPEFHHWLTPEEFGQEFGVSDADVAQLTSWLTAQGFVVKSVSPSRMSITFSGTTDQVSSAFGARLHQFRQTNGQTFLANATPVQIPSAFSEVVSAVAGLNNFRARPMHRDSGLVQKNVKTGEVTAVGSYAARANLSIGSGAGVELTNTQAPRHLVAPGDFAAMYNLKPATTSGLDGTGQSISIVAKSDVLDSDVQAFHSSFGLPAPKLTRYIVNTNPSLTNSEGEADLDVQWSSAVAHNAMINLVLASDTATTDGVILASQYIVDHNLSPVVSVSWGLCELFEGSENQLLGQLWQQAAAQGQSVAVATGDSGSPLCDAGNQYATYGLAVNALASSPNVVAVGGTDLYGTYTAPSTYWNATNAADYTSAKGYIPEVPWNDSCANPLVLAALRNLGATDTTTEALCNDSKYTNWRLVVGGSGGQSNCLTSVQISATGYLCKGGYAKPSWQMGVTGMPPDTSRDLPDVSLFAGDGLWGSAYIYCQSDVSATGTCDYTNPSNITYMAAGGTSFATPAFAGVLAMLVQQQGGRIGNPNPTLYSLGKSQFVDPARAQACTAENATAGNACIFYDITQSNNAAPCRKYSTNCLTMNPADSYGIVTGWSSNTGYDLTSGLGTLNISNLVSAWPNVVVATTPTTTSLVMNQATANYGDTLTGTVTVASASGTPQGYTSVVSDNFGAGAFALSPQGTAAVTLTGLPAGQHALTAMYGGLTPYQASQSSPVALVIARAPTTVLATTTRKTVTGATAFTLVALVSTSQNVSAPTGTVTVTNQTTGTTLGVFPITATGGSGNLASGVTVNLSSAGFQSGVNQIAVTYSGDSNFSGSTTTALSITYTPQFSLSFGQSSFTITANGSSSIPVTITSNGAPLPANVMLSCPAGLPAFLTCSFSPALISAGGTTATSTLTVFAAPLSASLKLPVQPGWRGRSYAELALLLLVPFGLRKRRTRVAALCLLCGCAAMVGMTGCGSGSPAYTSLTLSTNATTVNYQGQVTLTASLSGTKGIPGGTVVFTEGRTELGRGTISGGTATLTTTKLAVGPHLINAAYSGDSGNTTSYSNGVNVDVTYSFTLGIQATDSLGNKATASLPAVVQ